MLVILIVRHDKFVRKTQLLECTCVEEIFGPFHSMTDVNSYLDKHGFKHQLGACGWVYTDENYKKPISDSTRRAYVMTPKSPS